MSVEAAEAFVLDLLQHQHSVAHVDGVGVVQVELDQELSDVV